jgi:hypothetical protein
LRIIPSLPFKTFDSPSMKPKYNRREFSPDGRWS